MNIKITGDELKNSFPLDDGRRFANEAGQAFAANIRAIAGLDTGRVRARRPADEQSFALTLEVLLANIVAASLNVVNPDKYLAVGFAKHDYVGSQLSFRAMSDCRDALRAAGLINVHPGFRRPDQFGEGHLGFRTRLRPTQRLLGLITTANLGERPLRCAQASLVRMNRREESCEELPLWIASCQEEIQAVNARIAASGVTLPPSKIAEWKSLGAPYDGEDSEDWIRRVAYRGDMAATDIYRVFTGNWQSGGRFYGGWWMGAPSNLRPFITIEGQPVVELDFKTLHPRLLFNRKRIPLTFDPYILPEWNSPEMRSLGKRTVNRLLNRKVTRTKDRLNLNPEDGDENILPSGVSFTEYRDKLIAKLIDISDSFGIGAGVALQYEDSELALAIMTKMEDAEIAVLSVHDSFIVQRQHEQALRNAMERAFYIRYAQQPEISRTLID